MYLNVYFIYNHKASLCVVNCYYMSKINYQAAGRLL